MVCIATGPSLDQAQVDLVGAAQLEGRVRVVAVNDAYLLAPFADVLYFADARWWRWHKDRAAFQAFAGIKCTMQNSGAEVEDPAVFMLRQGNDDGLSQNPEQLSTGRNSGYMAINFAVLAGAARIVLLGFDHKPVRGKHTHFFGEHPEPTVTSLFRETAKHFRTMKAPLAALGVEVFNCTPESGIDAFPKADLASVLRPEG